MVTYSNECELQRASCSQPPGSPPLTVIFYGDCREKNAVAPSTLHAFIEKLQILVIPFLLSILQPFIAF
jgi:hypothetical protein